MRSTALATILVCGSLTLAACGGGESGTPLISGSLSGSYAGDAFTPDVGFAMVYMGDNMIALGDGNLNCGSPSQNDPPSGTSAVFAVPSFDPGSYSGIFVDLIHNEGNFEGVGTNTGTVTITASSADSVAGTIAFDYTDQDGKMYSLSGSFEVSRCP